MNYLQSHGDAVKMVNELYEALAESVKLQSHYAALLNIQDGGERMTFDDPDQWIERLRSLKEEPVKCRHWPGQVRCGVCGMGMFRGRTAKPFTHTRIGCKAEIEARCTEPFHVDDGVPYCDTCGVFRQSKVTR